MTGPATAAPSAPSAPATPASPLSGPSGCRAREVLDLVAGKWSLAVVDTLGAGPMRFSELKRAIGGISQRMLTVTLRGLERDGILTRTVYAVMPPNVTYELTTMGRTLLEATRPVVQWSLENIAAIDAARAEFDASAEPS
ncbi:winged helix-turn-helix transcriptional regulator [Actinopolymorpha pittospori]|uniref:DNA-binding HxlR family transcriptional regulator n=1 Tax=Actinopolymorpha pittospori TaxID=648752 RepID=A0A927MS43_9ACTN|nr:helix-turn-helix domain-containing protein [Actinopolymorpha pittospori]MBE1605870.1 DNA-binding HxlR family transcriptional regulator [Actinopolymorpha pittospori]